MNNLPETLEYPILAKIVKKEHVSDLLNGKLYMNNLKYFVDLEQKTGIAGVGDIREASLASIKKHRLFIQIDGEERNEIEIEPPPGIIYDTDALYHPVFCCMHNDIKLQREGKTNEYLGTMKLTEKNFIDFTENNQDTYKIVIILDVCSFFARFKSALEKNNIMANIGPVQYRDRSIPNIQNGQWILDNTFIKDIRFKDQLEFRFELLFRSPNPYILDIGNIQDIAISADCEKLIYPGFHIIQELKEAGAEWV